MLSDVSCFVSSLGLREAPRAAAGLAPVDHCPLEPEEKAKCGAFDGALLLRT